MTMPIGEVAKHFPSRIIWTGENKFRTNCPIHMDRTPSLDVQYWPDTDKITVLCRACGRESTQDIIDAVGLTWADLGSGTENLDAWTKAIRWYTGKNQNFQYQDRYDYQTIEGTYVFSRVRFRAKDENGNFEKQLRYATWYVDEDLNEKVEWSLRGKSRKDDFPDAVFSCDLVAFKNAVSDGSTVFYAEGEKDVRTAYSLGFPSVTCGSCGDWHEECKPLFAGADLVILCDNDEAGRKQTREIMESLRGTAKRIRIVTPCPDIDKGDVTDFVEHGGTREQLLRMIDAANDELPLDRFHMTNAKGAITGVFDAEILDYLKSTEHIKIIGGTPYIYQNGVYIADKSGAMLKTKIRNLIYPEFIKAPTVKRVYDLFISDAALQAETEDMDKYPAHWICFRDGMYDPIKQEMHQHSPKYFALHQIPHDFPSNPKSSETVKNWLEFIAQPDDRKMLLQYAGYCMTRDTRQQKMLILSGEGGTGKSLVIRLIEDMVGPANRSNVSIEQFPQRFSAIRLFGKLLNACADLKIKALEDVSLIKKAVGEDTLEGEAKGKDSISFKSCAKIVFSINQLPPVREEKTEGFYRRLLVLTMNRKPSEPDPDLYRKLSAELDAFMAMALDALHEMYAAGTITESEQSRKTVRDWRKKSDTVTAFLDDCTERDPAAIVKRSDFRRAYEQYCSANERMTHKKSVFNDILEEQHGIPRNTMLHGEYVVRGYKLLPIPIDL